MEIQLQELIDKIKKDGVEAAESEAEAIINAAKSEAEKIISDANEKAEKIMSDAKAENEKVVKSGEDAITQAGRNLLISFRQSVAKELTAIVSDKINEIYSSDALADIIVNVVKTWAEKPDAEELEIILNSNDLARLEETLTAALKNKMQKGVTLKANDNLDAGFRVAINEGSAYYDYSAEAVTSMLSNYLSPKVTELLKKAE